MQAPNKLTNPNWGWTSGMALGLGAAAGAAWQSCSVFTVVAVIVTVFMVWRAQRVR